MSDADDALAALLRALPSAPDATPRERAELLWLVARMARPAPATPEMDDWNSDEDDEWSPPGKQPDREDARVGSLREARNESRFGAASPEGSTGWKPEIHHLPALPALEDRRGHARGLAELATRRPTRARTLVDLDTSLRRSAVAGEPMLATTSGTRAATHLVLLVDRALSLAPWAPAVDELARLARATPGLAAVRVLDLDLSSPATARVIDQDEPVDLARVPRAGLDTLVVLWSDGLSPGFLALGAPLASLPSGARVAWMHPWPRHAWRRTPVGRLRPSRPGRSTPQHVPVVVAPASREGWAALGAWMHERRPTGLPVLSLPTATRPTQDRAPVDWDAHVGRLGGVLEPESLRLLGLAAALPADGFPIEQLRAAGAAAGLAESPFRLAEALTAGLLERSDDGLLRFRSEAARAAAREAMREADFAALAASALAVPDTGPALERAPRAEDTVGLPLYTRGDDPDGGGRAVAVDSAPADLVAARAVETDPPDRPVPPPSGVSPSAPRGPVMTRLVHTTLQGALKALEQDLLARSRAAGVEAGLRAAWQAEQAGGQTGLGFDPWRRERITQIAVAWVLSVVFVRTLEDRGYIDPRVAGVDAAALRAAEDRQELFGQIAPFCGPREYLLTVFRELARLPGAKHVFDARHNPVWVLAPSSEGAAALLDFFRRVDDAGVPVLTFPGADTRFLGDLYQNLSEDVRKRYALLQTPEFVEEFILEQTLDPAIDTFGLDEVRLIDPTCGSGHFLLGGFARLFARWQAARPMEPVEDLARRALDQVYGVDINPYAVAIARFRLVLAVLDTVGITRLDKAPDLAPNLVVADSLLHRFKDTQTRLSSQVTLEEAKAWGDELYALSDREAVERVLTKRFHAVVGNPPYITEKDPKKREMYREMYESASGKYALAAPFTERFFGLAIDGGYVGMINSNAWTKREYGKTLIEQVLPRFDVHKIVDTAGCYIPGHGTPTLLLFGRNQAPGEAPVVAVLGKRGEQQVPPDPAEAPVWQEIVAHHNDGKWDSPESFVSVEPISRDELSKYPWVLAGGGARQLLNGVIAAEASPLSVIVESVGIVAVTGEDAVYPQRADVFRRLGVEPTKPMLEGVELGDWDAQLETHVPWMYDSTFAVRPESELASIVRYLWPYKPIIGGRKRFGVPMLARGYKWYELQEVYPSKLSSRLSIAFSLVATHFRPVLFQEPVLFKNSAPVIKLPASADLVDHQALLGYLNSSVANFWCRLVMFPKGGDQVGDGARLSATQWNRHLEFGGNLLQQLPVPNLDDLKPELHFLVEAAEKLVADLGERAPDKVLADALEVGPTLEGLRTARDAMLDDRARLRGMLVSLQEEMDWRVYRLFGLPTVVGPDAEELLQPVAPEHRPFEVRLARDVATDISASEWFRLHQRTPPSDVGGPFAELYRQRLRLLDSEEGKQLRLLETPETKRRWSPPDDAGAFRDAARAWLLDRVEAVFREQGEPTLLSPRQVALDLRADPRVQAVAELLAEETGHDLGRLLAEQLDKEAVPFLAALRYTATGMEKRRGSHSEPDEVEGWELTWDLQRAEDAGRLPEALAAKKLKAIPVPDKYGPPDFQRHYWGLRGALDVPKERFVSVYVGGADDDPTPLYGWAGWGHLKQAQALSQLYQRRRNEDGWPKERLVPLLAGLEERVPWLLQWHNAPSASFHGMKLGDFFRDFLHAQAHELGVSITDLRAWRPAPATRGRGRAPALAEETVLAALRAWDGREDPRADDLADRLGASKPAVTKLLKALTEAGNVVLTSGRPARYRLAGGA